VSTPETSRAGSTSRQLAPLPIAAAVVAIAATVTLWVVLAAVTGLIFHFLPGATFLAGTYIFRLADGGRRATMPESAAVLLAGAIGTSIGLLAVQALGRDLDAPLATLLVIVAGAAMAMVWLRRSRVADRPEALRESRDA